MAEEGINLKSRLESIEKNLSTLVDKKEKKFKLPFGRKVSNGQARKNYILVIKINENGQLDFKKLQITNQTIIEDGIPRLSGSQYIMYYKKMPVIILPSWSVEPLSLPTYYQKSLNDGSNINGYKILMDRMLKEQIKPTKQITGIIKWIFIIGIIGIIVYAFLTGG